MEWVHVYHQSGDIEAHRWPFVGHVPPGMVPTTARLKLSLLESDGLIAEVYFNVENSDEAKMAIGEDAAAAHEWDHTGLWPYLRVRLVSKDELYQISRIEVDGDIVIWRQGDCLINGELFYAATLKYFSDANTASTNRKIVQLFSYLKSASPDTDDAAITRMLGIPYLAFKQILDQEGRNLPSRTDAGLLDALGTGLAQAIGIEDAPDEAPDEAPGTGSGTPEGDAPDGGLMDAGLTAAFDEYL
jgi:hypothetical protein